MDEQHWRDLLGVELVSRALRLAGLPPLAAVRLEGQDVGRFIDGLRLVVADLADEELAGADPGVVDGLARVCDRIALEVLWEASG